MAEEIPGTYARRYLRYLRYLRLWHLRTVPMHAGMYGTYARYLRIQYLRTQPPAGCLQAAARRAGPRTGAWMEWHAFAWGAQATTHGIAMPRVIIPHSHASYYHTL